MLCRVVAVKKVSPYSTIVQVIFYFLWDHLAYPVFFVFFLKIEYGLSRRPRGVGGGEGGGGSVCSLANYSVSYEVTQSNRVSNF